jgi:hypothetical protein
VRNDRAVWSCASSPVHTASTDNSVSFWHERNEYAEEGHDGRGSSDYPVEHETSPKGKKYNNDSIVMPHHFD